MRYAATGVLGASLNVLITVFLTEYFGLHYLVSLAICSAIVIMTGFFLNRSWTFRKQGAGILTELLKYVLVTGINVMIGLVACAFLVEHLKVPYAYGIAIVAIVFAPATYLVHRAWTFGLTWLRGR